jgi:hypothetical protein
MFAVQFLEAIFLSLTPAITIKKVVAGFLSRTIPAIININLVSKLALTFAVIQMEIIFQW